MMHLCQEKYDKEVLSKAGMTDYKLASTPIASTRTLSHYEGDPLEYHTTYKSIVEALQYCTNTRPDINFGVNNQFLHQPTTTHLQAVKRILRYLKGTLTHGIKFTSGSSYEVIYFTDADWARCPDDRKSIGGYCIFIGTNLISWTSHKRVVSRSSTNAEFRALADGVLEVTWMENVLKEVWVNYHTLFVVCDNLSIIQLASNPVLHAQTKHVEIDYYVV